jgi:hypothetical protein
MVRWMARGALVFAACLVGCDGDESSSPGEGGSAGAAAQGGTAGEGGAGGGPANEPPLAVITATPPAGSAPLDVTLSGSESSDPDGEIVAYAWTIDGDDAGGEEIARSFEVGCHDVELTVTDDRGATASATLVVPIASGQPQVPPTVTVSEAPLPSAVLPRDVATDVGTAHFAGTVESDGFTEIRADVMAGAEVRQSVAVPVCGAAPATFAIDVPVPSELTAFDVRLYLVGGDESIEVYSVADLVAGDVYVVTGQSNSVAAQQSGDANENQGPFVRSFGTNSEDGNAVAADVAWRVAEGNAGGGAGAIGQWAIRMAAQLVLVHETPIGVVNGGRGGQPIAYFQRDDANPENLATNYGRLLVRLRNAGLEGALRAILWYQGESDGPNFQAHHDGFVALDADWAEDYAGVEQVYVTQVRMGCAGDLIRLQEVQRRLADDFDHITVMSTTGLDGHDGCHYAYANGYRELGDRYAALLGRDLYGAMPATDVAPPNPASAQFAAGGTQVTITLRNPDSLLTADAAAGANFRFEGAAASVTSATIAGNQLVLAVNGDAAAATGLSYLGHTGAGPWVLNESGIGLLEFYDLPVAAE